MHLEIANKITSQRGQNVFEETWADSMGEKAEIAGGEIQKSIENCIKAEGVIIIVTCRSQGIYRI